MRFEFALVQSGNTRLHTYIHNWPLQPFSQDYGLASHRSCCVRSFYTWVEGPTVYYRLRTTDFLRNFLMVGLFTFRTFCQKSAERKSPKKYIFFIFRFDAWLGIRTRALRTTATYLITTTSIPIHTAAKNIQFSELRNISEFIFFGCS